jgi:hypothetical protein
MVPAPVATPVAAVMTTPVTAPVAAMVPAPMTAVVMMVAITDTETIGAQRERPVATGLSGVSGNQSQDERQGSESDKGFKSEILHGFFSF